MVECVICGPFKWAGLRRGITLIKCLMGQLKRRAGFVLAHGFRKHGPYDRDGVRDIMALSVDGRSLRLVHIVADQEGD